MLNKNDLYIGMSVVCRNKDNKDFSHTLGTIIALHDMYKRYDCLVEFDTYVGGHDGLGWGETSGKKGHCYWFWASEIEVAVDDASKAIPEAYDITYDMLFNG